MVPPAPRVRIRCGEGEGRDHLFDLAAQDAGEQASITFVIAGLPERCFAALMGPHCKREM